MTFGPSGFPPTEFDRPEHARPRRGPGAGPDPGSRSGSRCGFTKYGGDYWHPYGDAVPADSRSHAARSLHKYGLPGQPLGLAVDCDFYTSSWQEAAAIFEAVLGLGIWRGLGFYRIGTRTATTSISGRRTTSRYRAAIPGRSGSRIPRPGATTSCRRPPTACASCGRSRADGRLHRQPDRGPGGTPCARCSTTAWRGTSTTCGTHWTPWTTRSPARATDLHFHPCRRRLPPATLRRSPVPWRTMFPRVSVCQPRCLFPSDGSD